MVNRFCKAIATLLICTGAYAQSTKVVVIPLASDSDVEQCKVTTECNNGSANLSCPEGNFVVACALPKLVFVTSSSHTGNLGGLDGADMICQDLATAQNLLGEYKAWLGDSTKYPSNRFYKNLGPYRLTNGTIIAESYSDLTSANLASNISHDERGISASNNQHVWSNVLATGIQYSSEVHCNNWTSASFNDYGALGFLGSSYTNSLWSYSSMGRCSHSRHFYCFEQ